MVSPPRTAASLPRRPSGSARTIRASRLTTCSGSSPAKNNSSTLTPSGALPDMSNRGAPGARPARLQRPKRAGLVSLRALLAVPRRCRPPAAATGPRASLRNACARPGGCQMGLGRKRVGPAASCHLGAASARSRRPFLLRAAGPGQLVTGVKRMTETTGAAMSATITIPTPPAWRSWCPDEVLERCRRHRARPLTALRCRADTVAEYMRTRMGLLEGGVGDREPASPYADASATWARPTPVRMALTQVDAPDLGAWARGLGCPSGRVGMRFRCGHRRYGTACCGSARIPAET